MRQRFLSLFATLAAIAVLYPTSVATAAAAPSVDTSAIDSLVRGIQDANRIPGIAIAVVKDGEVTYSAGYGHADEKGRPVTSETPFILGSLSKSITATAVMQLNETHQLSIDAPVRTYLPSFTLANSDYASRITLRNLLNHTSGIPEDAEHSSGSFINDSPAQSMDQLISMLRSANSEEPGKAFEYSNINYVILGSIIEHVTAQSYVHYVTSHILQPLNMQHTYFSLEDGKAHGLASGYESLFGFTYPRTRPFPPQYLAAGYIISTATDMSHFLIAQLNDGVYHGKRILTSDSVTSMHTTPRGVDSTYAMGWLQLTAFDENVLLHDGAVPNYYTSMVISPEHHIGSIVLSNHSAFLEDVVDPMVQINFGILKIVRHEALPPQIPSLPLVLWIFFALVVVVIAIEIVTAISLRSWRQRFRRRGRLRKILFVILSVVGALWNGGMLLLTVPAVMGMPIFFSAFPDLAPLAAILFVVAAVNVLGRAVVIGRSVIAALRRRTGRAPQPQS